MLAYCNQTGEALAGQLRPGNAGANTAADQITVAEAAIAQIPAEHIASIEILLRVDSAGAAMSFWTGAAKRGSATQSAMT
jgi:hypothetical protein